MNRMHEQLQRALKECERLKRENNQLKQLLQRHNIPIKENHNQWNNTKSFTKQEILHTRIKIYRNLFKGRDDVYATRWKNKDGEYVYSPDRRRVGENQQNLPLTNQVIYNHLAGKKTIGIYPLLKDETCWFLAIDFDKENWQEDVIAFIDVCKELNVPASIERSRSGNGGHVWIFFNHALPAKTARKLGNMLLSRTLEKRYQVGMDSYDRMFPSQDTMPKGGYGNLIALPLQHHRREKGNSVFVDENFNAFPDQWAYLSDVRKMTEKDVLEVTKQFNADGPAIRHVKESQITDEKMPEKLQVKCKNGIYIPIETLPSSLINKIIQLATFNNPEFFKAQANRLSTYKIPRKIDCSYIEKNDLILPRGCMDDLIKLCKQEEMELIVQDETNRGTKLNIDFHGQLTTLQEEALHHLLENQSGILSATTGFGKTVVGASLISKRKVNTLIIVHKKQLIDQWKDRLTSFLKLSKGDIGQIGGGKHKPSGNIDIATIQTLNYKGNVKDIIEDYGQIIIDECHHISAFSFEKVLKKAKASYVYGLTATPNRKDGLERIMKMQCSPIRYKVNAKDQAKVRPFKHILVPRKTSFKSNKNNTEITVQSLYAEMVQDEKRNELIFNDVLKELENGSSPIILTERVEHVQLYEKMFKDFAKNIIVLTGRMKKAELDAKFKLLEEIPDEEERLLISTGKYIGEGFDHTVLDTLFLTMPIGWKGTLQQYVGRLHRLHKNKEVVKVYDYVDHREEVCRDMFAKRKKGYQNMGYIIEGGSAKGKGNSEQMKLF